MSRALRADARIGGGSRMTGIGGSGPTSDSPFEPHLAQIAPFPPSKDRYGVSQPGRKTANAGPPDPRSDAFLLADRQRWCIVLDRV